MSVTLHTGGIVTPGRRPGFEIVRVVKAPVERVWRVLTKPESFAAWWGGDAAPVDVETVRFSAVVGAPWRATMVLPSADDHGGAESGPTAIEWHGEVVSVAEPVRLAFTLADQPGDEFEVATFVLRRLDGHTELSLTQHGSHLTPAQYAQAKAGWETFVDVIARLAEER